MRVGGIIGFCGGFLLAYQNSSSKFHGVLLGICPHRLIVRFWGWRENKREEEMDLKELTQRAKEGKPLYGESSHQPWVQNAAHQNSVFSQLKFGAKYSLSLFVHSDMLFSRHSNVGLTNSLLFLVDSCYLG